MAETPKYDNLGVRIDAGIHREMDPTQRLQLTGSTTEEELNAFNRELMALCKSRVPDDVGVTIFLTNYNLDAKNGKFLAYLSSVRREDMILTVVEWLTKIFGVTN